MTINNRNTIIHFNINRFIIIVCYVTLISISVFTSIFELYLGQINKTIVVIAASILFLMYLAYYYILKYNYFNFSDNGSKLVFHYISLNLLNRKKNAVEILKSNFNGYKLKKSFFGKKIEIILYTKTKNGIAKYPPISISSLTKSQIQVLISSLKNFA